MADDPFQVPDSEGGPFVSDPQEIFLCDWNGHDICVSAAMIPIYLPVLGELRISVDGGPNFISKNIRMQDHVEFEIDHNGETVTGHAETYGIAIRFQRFRIHVEDACIAEAAVQLENGVLGFVLGIFIGMGFMLVVSGVSFWLLLSLMAGGLPWNAA